LAGRYWQLASHRLSLKPFAPVDRAELVALFKHPGVLQIVPEDTTVVVVSGYDIKQPVSDSAFVTLTKLITGLSLAHADLGAAQGIRARRA
jgi:hypothetical protein